MDAICSSPKLEKVILKDIEIPVIQKIRCPNCGSEGERHYIVHSQLSRTQCPVCDYLMVSCMRTGKVIEAYAPGINPGR
jgi:ribosomal protein L37AE/L43A